MPRTLLLEVGCEELPTSFVRVGTEQLGRRVAEELDRARVPYGSVRALGTPRRLSVVVEGVSEEIAPRTEELWGPAESAARAPDGSWTKAAEGFARKNNLSMEALSVGETPKGRYLRAEKQHPGGSTAEKLPAAISAALASVAFPKSMRWAEVETAFGRPIQWLVALFGQEILTLEYAKVHSGRNTRGHRFLAPDTFDLASADGYVEALRKVHVLVDPEERRAAMVKALHEAAQKEGGELVPNAFLVEEVSGLVEEPFVVVGRFDPSYLELPEELIETVMSHHQRYFAVRKQGKMLPLFLTVANTALDPERIRKGNERVMRARLADARFFVTKDRGVKLATRIPRLDGVVYHQKLGSYGDKARRLVGLAPLGARLFGVETGQLVRAAELCKADLVSDTVGEFPELQGLMGRDYARHDHEAHAVADAIAEHYQPRGAEDSVAPSAMGAALGFIDRLDTLVGFFAIGQKPSGAGDPFGLRRAALGLLRTILERKIRLQLGEILVEAARGYELFAKEKATQSVGQVVDELSAFIRERLEGMLVQKFAPELVRACMAASAEDPLDLVERVTALNALRSGTTFAEVARSFERAFNITREAPSGEPDRSKLTLSEEVVLLAAYDEVKGPFRAAVEARKFDEALSLLAEKLPGPVDQFFAKVFVMDPDPVLRDARLRMLRGIAELAGNIARFDALAG